MHFVFLLDTITQIVAQYVLVFAKYNNSKYVCLLSHGFEAKENSKTGHLSFQSECYEYLLQGWLGCM